MKKIISLVIAAIMLCTTVFAHPFTDVAGHWGEAEIEKAFNTGVVNGDGDGMFRPDDSVSRGEFLKMVATLIVTKFGGTIPDEFGDTTHWASKYYTAAQAILYKPLTEAEKIDDVIPGRFGSAEDYDKPIKRWEMAFMIGESMVSTLNVMGGEAYAATDEIAGLYPAAVESALRCCMGLGIMKGDDDGKINPDSNGTRAEAVTLINRMDAKIDEVIKSYEDMVAEEEKKYEESKKTYETIPEGHPVVTVEMENGEKFKIELYPEYAPQTVANFVVLVEEGFYDGLTFHRVIKDFMAQGGDPVGDGTGDANHTIVGEFSQNGFEQNTLTHERGTISMARANHFDSASCQFFICYEPVPSLDGIYAAFGKVIEGMEVVDAFLDTEMVENNIGEIAQPSKPIVMKKLTVSTANNSNSEKTVYIMKNYNEYHKQRCSYLRGDVTAISLSEAEAQGKTACKRCGGI